MQQRSLPAMARGQKPIRLAAIRMLVCLGMTVAPWTSVWAANTKDARATLRGVPGMTVGVADVVPELERSGISTSQLQATVEGQLRRAGIPVFSAQEASSHPGAGFLGVSVTLLHHEIGMYAYSIDLAVYQTATIQRDAMAMSLPTWSIGHLGMVGSDNLPTLSKSINTSVEQFIQAYRAVNSRRTGKTALRSGPATASSRARIRSVQKRLQAMGLRPGRPDGALGPQSRQALRRYQQKKGVPVTGDLDKRTLKALRIR